MKQKQLILLITISLMAVGGVAGGIFAKYKQQTAQESSKSDFDPDNVPDGEINSCNRCAQKHLTCARYGSSGLVVVMCQNCGKKSQPGENLRIAVWKWNHEEFIKEEEEKSE